MKTFLVPVDFSAVTDSVIDTALTFAKSFAGRLVLLHVVQPPVITGEYSLPVEVLQEAISASEKSALRHFDRYVESGRAAGVEVETVLRHGPPVAVILEEAKRVSADYLVMGSHGHGKLYDLLVGSTSAGIITKARCAVIILPPVHGKRAATA